MAFRDNLLHLRASHNMTQEQLAVLIGVSRQSVTKWESGKAYPEMDKLITLSKIFNCSLDELVQGDMTQSKPATSTTSIPDTSQDIFGYDDFMRTFTRKVSNGVMFIILGVAFAIMFFQIADVDSNLAVMGNADSTPLAIGLIIIFAGIALGLANLIPAGMEHSVFVKEHPYLEDFYTKDQKQAARKSFVNQLIAGIVCIFAGVCLVIVLDSMTATQLYAPTALLICIAIGVRLLIGGGMTLSRVDISTYNEKVHEEMTEEEISASDLPEQQKAEMLATKKTNNQIGAWCGIIMIIATIVGLVLLFLPQYQSPFFWLAWPIGGLLCAIVTLLFKAIKGEE